MVWDTATNIINDAAVELGLIPFAGKLDDPFTSTDINIGQLCQLMKGVGQGLRQVRQWTQLQAEATITTVADQEAYALPSDFTTMIDQTGWNRTNRFPLAGPATPQEWQYLKASAAGVTINVVFRPLRGWLYIYNAPAGQDIHFEYMSSFWVLQGAEDVPTTDFPEAGADIIWFDGRLVTLALKLAWLRQKGLDYAAAEEEYKARLQLCMGEDAEGPVLRLSGARGMRLINEDNLPSTGYGS